MDPMNGILDSFNMKRGTLLRKVAFVGLSGSPALICGIIALIAGKSIASIALPVIVTFIALSFIGLTVANTEPSDHTSVTQNEPSQPQP